MLSLKDGQYIADAQRRLAEILENHGEPAKTLAHATWLEVSAGKNTYTYDAHTYHTKVPPQGIMEFIENYLPQGGVMLDPFAGSGMTGVAARMAGADVILNELSPAACFIAHNFTEPVAPEDFAAAARGVLDRLAEVRRDLYVTTCRECRGETEILYTVWSYRVLCSSCSAEFRLWDYCRQYGETVREHKILKEFACPCCDTRLIKRKLVRTKAEPVMIGYKCCSKVQVEHPPCPSDLEKIQLADSGCYLQKDYYPTTRLRQGVNLNQPLKHGLGSIDQFYTARNLSAMSHLWRAIHCIDGMQLSSAVAFVFTSLYQRVTRLAEFRFWGGSGNTARFNVPFIFNEANVFVTFERKAASILDHMETTAVHYKGRKAVFCNSATDLSYLPDNSIDFIFTDPPFGANINYSEMNVLWEAWLGEFTDHTHEAIINKAQGKSIGDYQLLMGKCLSECYRVLRAEHWMLLIFMNSSKEVWHALKAAIRKVGFITKRIDIFDKQHGTFKQFVSHNTAGCDLVLHCLKPLPDERIETEIKPVANRASIELFMDKRDMVIPSIEYLHVVRDNETNLRRLYSEWLSYALPEDHELVDFSTFRTHVTELIKAKKKD